MSKPDEPIHEEPDPWLDFLLAVHEATQELNETPAEEPADADEQPQPPATEGV